MSALAVPAKIANKTATTPTISIILFLFFATIPLIGTPPNAGLQLILFWFKVYCVDEKAVNADRHRPR
jgi:hypothetical protein